MEQLNTFPFINQNSLQTLIKNAGGNQELVNEIFQSFIEDTAELIEQIEQSSKQNNTNDYYAAVHTLKGLSGTIGCTRMFELLKIMDSLNKESDFDSSADFLPKLNEVFDHTCQAIKKEVFV